jgi:hypothetical protein
VKKQEGIMLVRRKIPTVLSGCKDTSLDMILRRFFKNKKEPYLSALFRFFF